MIPTLGVTNLPSPVSPVAMAAAGAEARLGNLPATVVAASIASPDLQFQSRQQNPRNAPQAPQNAATTASPATDGAATPPRTLSGTGSAPGGASSFLAQLLGQGSERMATATAENGFANLKYLPSNASAPPPPSPRDMLPAAKEMPPSVASMLREQAATSPSPSAATPSPFMPSALPSLEKASASFQRSNLLERMEAKASPGRNAKMAASLVLPRGVDAYLATSSRNRGNLSDTPPELNVAA